VHTHSRIHNNTHVQLLHKVCQDPQTVVDMYVNYDCDLNHTDIYAKMVQQLARVAQSGFGAHSVNGMTREQEQQLRTKGADALTTMVESLVEWSKRVDNDTVWRENGEVVPKAVHREANPESRGEGDVVEGTPRRDGHADGTNNLSRSNSGNQLAPNQATRAADVDEDRFMKIKEKKVQLQQGIKLFNLKGKKGIEALVASGHLEKKPESVASFFHTCEGLDKRAVGDYMGEPDEFNKGVLYAYVDGMSFNGMTIDGALRHFLSGFWLPGEAQKIDRMMEKFAERYCGCTGAFANADTAYVLAYSIIMLNTDAHSPKVIKKMTKEEFLRNNRGINDGADLPADFLEGIYDRITAQGFKVDASAEDFASHAENGQKIASSQERYRAEAQLLMNTAQGQLKRAAELAGDDLFYRASQREHVSSMFNVVWAPMLAAFSVLMEESTESKIVSLCLRGLVGSITILSIFGMHSQRDAYVSTLTQFTNLHSHTIREMRQKNLDSIRATLTVARTTGNYLGSAWFPVLRCISLLDRLHLIGQRHSSGHSISSANDSDSAMIEEFNSAVLEYLDMADVDRIFSSSAHLSDEAIVDFVQHLCAISREEIESCPTQPRVFSMQKIVEITYFNMSRIRIVWSRIWSILSMHFQAVALSSNIELAMYAIDSMRQLALKFLEKDELSSFHFQRDFLKPFDTIVANSKVPEIRELVIRCLTQVVLSCSRNIRSGWKATFQALTIAAKDPNIGIVNLAFDLVGRIAREFFTQIVEDKAFGSVCYIDCIHTLCAFAGNISFTSRAMEAIDMIASCTERCMKVGHGPVFFHTACVCVCVCVCTCLFVCMCTCIYTNI
jgi:brefeldin A-inhibited guanine nucleotide-exchange protein